MNLISSLRARTTHSRLLVSCASTSSQVVWLDARAGASYAENHIDESAHIPHEEIALRIADLDLDKDTEIRAFCRSGRRARVALAALEELG